MGDGDYTRKILTDPWVVPFCGELQGKTLLDIGCGEGRFCRMMAALGANPVGIDPTLALIEEAARRDVGRAYVRSSGERLPFGNCTFDIAVFYLTLIDIPDFRNAIREAARVLRPGGRLVSANLAGHATTSASAAGWVRDENGNRVSFPIDHYLDEYSVICSWKDIVIHNWHRPMSAYMECYLEEGLLLRRFVEPAPTADQIRDNPTWDFDRRVPYTNVMLWEKA